MGTSGVYGYILQCRAVVALKNTMAIIIEPKMSLVIIIHPTIPLQSSFIRKCHGNHLTKNLMDIIVPRYHGHEHLSENAMVII
jgi:hypothetical protein